MDVIDISHKIKTNGEGPAPIHCRMRTKLLKDLIMRYKGRYFKTPDAELKFTIVEDLTPQNRQLLKQMKERADVESAWSMNGSIKFKKKDDTSTVHTAKLSFNK